MNYNKIVQGILDIGESMLISGQKTIELRIVYIECAEAMAL